MDVSQAIRILGLRPNATLNEAKETWRDLAKVWHPDRFANDPQLRHKVGEKLKEINEAYQYLQSHGMQQDSDASSFRGTRGQETSKPKVQEPLAKAKAHIAKAANDWRVELVSVRAARASPSLLQHLKVDYYGTPSPLNQVATLDVSDPCMITVQPWDPILLTVIQKAILSSGCSLKSVIDGNILKVPISVPEEQRNGLVKLLHKMRENHRAGVLNIRRISHEALKTLLKEKKISEEDERSGREEIQKLTDDFMVELDRQARSKEREIMEMPRS